MSSTIALAALPSLLAACIALLIGSILTDRRRRASLDLRQGAAVWIQL